MIDILVHHWGATLLINAALFFLDHYLTIVGARRLRSLDRRIINLRGGYELNPSFAKDVANLRWLPWRHLTTALAGCSALAFVRLSLDPLVFEFLAGAAILQWLYLDLRHLQNIANIRDMATPGSVIGGLERSNWLSQRISARDWASQAVLFGVAAVATQRLFFVGGAAVCAFQSWRHFGWANRTNDLD